MSQQILQSSKWRHYDEYKHSRAQDPLNFLPDEAFEVDFLTQLLEVHYPQYTEMAIRLSIHHVRRTIYAGCRRNLFVKLVIDRLLQREPLTL